MTENGGTTSRMLALLPASLTGVALACHLLVGLMDQGRLALRIVGPLSPIVGWLWVIALVATIAIMAGRRVAIPSHIACAALACGGVAAIWWW